VQTTGYWFPTPSHESLPVHVEQFLAAGDPPVFVGFGSMSGRDPAATTAVVLDAARRARVRLIVGTGWGGLPATDGSDETLFVDEIDHQLLFPRVAAVAHHGGAGTTGTAFAAGRPQVVCPFVADQPFWGRLAHLHGVAPAPLPQTRLDPVRLAEAFTEAVRDRELVRRARRLGQRVRAEAGVATAISALERIAAAGAQCAFQRRRACRTASA
jgi:sterol 3beta-glucosyltransferase